MSEKPKLIQKLIVMNGISHGNDFTVLFCVRHPINFLITYCRQSRYGNAAAYTAKGIRKKYPERSITPAEIIKN